MTCEERRISNALPFPVQPWVGPSVGQAMSVSFFIRAINLLWILHYYIPDTWDTDTSETDTLDTET